MKKAKTTKPAHGAPAMSVRLLDRTYKMLEEDVKRDGLSSMNQAIQRRLDKSMIDQTLRDTVTQTTDEAALKFERENLKLANTLIDHMNKLITSANEAIANLRLAQDADRRVSDLQQMLLKELQKKEKQG
jgi:hypothetical protein